VRGGRRRGVAPDVSGLRGSVRIRPRLPRVWVAQAMPLGMVSWSCAAHKGGCVTHLSPRKIKGYTVTHICHIMQACKRGRCPTASLGGVALGGGERRATASDHGRFPYQPPAVRHLHSHAVLHLVRRAAPPHRRCPYTRRPRGLSRAPVLPARRPTVPSPRLVPLPMRAALLYGILARLSRLRGAVRRLEQAPRGVSRTPASARPGRSLQHSILSW
jgi:hypothetical protein